MKEHMIAESPMGIEGMAFLEFGTKDSSAMKNLFKRFGFSVTGKHKDTGAFYYEQNEVIFILNETPGSFAQEFTAQHGPCACSMGWKVKDAQKAFKLAVERGAKPYEGKAPKLSKNLPAVVGIGGSLIYFVDNRFDFRAEYSPVDDAFVPQKGLLKIDHLTNNVPVGEMDKWCNFYAKIFDFKEVRYFDIKGLKTGLVSKVMVSPGYKVIIPINEPTDTKSQIQEYLEEYKGSGIQHIAFLVSNAIHVVKALNQEEIQFLDAPPASYYEALPQRLPLLWETIPTLQSLSLLADGDEAGYLLQIFTKNMIGPIFFEMIQRENHWGFGEGNFKALFDSIERDQMKRGYLK